MALRAGILDGVATLDTEWSDEPVKAEQLDHHLGFPVQYIQLSENDIVDALPDTIHVLGESGKETVAIASNLVALYRSGAVPSGTLLPGHGSGLINSGLRVDAEVLDNVRSAVKFQLEQATVTGEFSGIAAAAHGYTVRHPFWNTDVIQTALDTASELMPHGGGEKGHLWEAVMGLLPSNIAWRDKQALYCGNGVDRNLDQALVRGSAPEVLTCPASTGASMPKPSVVCPC